MSAEIKTRIATVAAPYRREIWMDDVRFESGMRLLRVTIKEGTRFTQLDLDAATAGRRIATSRVPSATIFQRQETMP